MRFVSPLWLWVAAFMPVLLLVGRGEFVRRRKTLERFLPTKMWAALAPELNPGARPRKLTVVCFALAFAAVALARPQLGFKEEIVQVSGLDIVFVLDLSNSMYVEDVVPSRIKKARHVVRSILERLGGDRGALVGFASSSYLASPLTNDVDYLTEVLETMDPEMIANQGSDLSVGLETAAKALERGAQEGGSSEDDGSKVVVLLSDGEDLEGRAKESVKTIKELGARFFAFGVGTEAGGPIPQRDQYGVLRGFKKSLSGQPVVSRFDRSSLESLASGVGGRYYDVTTHESEVEDFVAQLGSLDRTGRSERRTIVYQERFQIPLLVAVLLLFIELGIPVRRKSKRASDVPKPKTASAPGPQPAALALALMFLAGQAHARDGAPAEVYLQNEKGLKAFKDGKLDEAQKRFGAAQARAPESPDLMYNQGVVQAQGGDMKGASKTFEEAAKMAKQAGRHDLEGGAYYNLGVARQKEGDPDGAVQAFSRSIEAAKAGSDAKLETDARKRLVSLAQEQQQKQQQQGGQGDKKEDQKDSDQKNDQQSQGGGEKKDEKDGGGDKDDPKKPPERYADKGQQQKKNGFKSAKLSPEDAERVMQELSEKEKQLQGKLGKKGAREEQKDKDW